MPMFYGNKFLDSEMLDQQPELTIYVSEELKLSLLEDPVMRTITVSNGKNISVKLNIANQEGCSRASSATGTTKAKHGPRVKYTCKGNSQGTPIQVRISSDKVFFGADSSCKNRTPKEESLLRTKEAKFAVKFVEDNKDKIIKLWTETNLDKVIETIKSMGNDKYIVSINAKDDNKGV